MPFHQACIEIEKPAIAYLVRESWLVLKLTQEKFAARPGIIPTLNLWKNGHVFPSLLALRHIDSLLKQLNNSPDTIGRECSKALQAKYFSPREERE